MGAGGVKTWYTGVSDGVTTWAAEKGLSWLTTFLRDGMANWLGEITSRTSSSNTSLGSSVSSSGFEDNQI